MTTYPTMMEILRTTKISLRDFLVEVFRDRGDYEIIFAEQSNPRVQPPYVVVELITGLVKTGSLDEHLPETDTESYRVRGFRRFTASITCIGKTDSYDHEKTIDPMGMALEIQNALELPTKRDFLTECNLSVVEDNLINDVPIQLETDVEPRAVYDIVFSIGVITEDDPGRIDTVEFEGNLDTDCDGVLDKSTGKVTVNI